MKGQAFDEIDPLRRRGKTGGGSSPFRPPKGSRKYAILRVGKLKTMGQIASAAAHNLRQMDVPNAASEQAPKNEILAGGDQPSNVLEAWRDRAPEKVRSNAVRALEYVITASPEAMAEMGSDSARDYLTDALDWLKERHGAENVLSAVIHNDESTPHLQALVIPLDDRERLNARAFVNGREALSAMQTDFAENVAQDHGLERGLEGSRAHHTEVKNHYARVKAVEKLSIEAPERLSGGFLGRGRESDGEWRSRASQSATEALRGAVAGMADDLEEMSRDVAQADDLKRCAELHELNVEALTTLVAIIQMDPGEEQLNLIKELADTSSNAPLPSDTLDMISNQLAWTQDEHGIKADLEDHTVEADLDTGADLDL